MNTKPLTAIALYTTFSDDFARKCLRVNTKYRVRPFFKREISFALLKYAYKQYFGIKIPAGDLPDYPLPFNYGGLYFDIHLSVNYVAVAVGENPLAIGAMSRPLKREWQPNDDLLHVNELAEYEQSGYSVDTLCSIWSKKIAFRKLHKIEKPSDADPFDNSFQKNIDSAAGEYTLRRFDCAKYAQYLAVTGEAEIKRVPRSWVFDMKPRLLIRTKDRKRLI